MRRLNHIWRLIGTALGFFFFGLGGFLLGILVFPLLKLLSPASQLQRRSRLVLHYILRAHVWLLRSLGVLKLEIVGAEKLNREGQLVLANHPCLLDVVFLISQIRNANCVVKNALWNNPFTGGPVRAANYVSNGDSQKMIQGCADSLDSGDSLMIFPEGTRTTPGKPLRFQRGAAQVALRSEATITPVVIHGALPAMTKDMKWFQIPERKMHFTLYVGEDIDISHYRREPNITVAVRRVTELLQNHFTEELEKHGGTGKRTEADDCRYA
ncbi:lysophospholipid acyltransferase family protein [Porticoccus sp. W117]|uniref:lysophospholipid acyltransferase family protein n=1 Tax=Porticoccus sp. W117 TaxID=3054777 RepID=UPI002592EC33|nr:lysophospholipid acyltransferase family protein [Porticoccus sp. W117]MDM3869859.1 lysophospholipid acyltransferase family protein [Porticoccus sp. W117]